MTTGVPLTVAESDPKVAAYVAEPDCASLRRASGAANRTMTQQTAVPGARRPRVMAVSSGGGHWVQLLRLRPAFADADVTFVTVSRSYLADLDVGSKFCTVPDSNMWQKHRLVLTAFSTLWNLLKLRPDVIVSTGAAPGYFAIRLGKRMGIRTVWIDSVANAQKLSTSGREAGKYADLWLTQWEHLAKPDGPKWFGSVL